eukprot:Rmarinus@m.10511
MVHSEEIELRPAVADSGKDENENMYDLGNMAVFDPAPIDAAELKKDTDGFLRKITRDNLQLLVNKMFQLPAKDTESGRVATLPPPSFDIPRSKPLPKPKPQTRWEKFALEKGIRKKKKDLWVWDDVHQEWRPRFGYKKANDQSDQWLIEAKAGVDDMGGAEDPFSRSRREKRERVDKQKGREIRNIREAFKPKAADLVKTKEALGKAGKRFTPKEQLAAEYDVARDATASMGKFDEKVDNEPKRKGVRRKFESAVQSSTKAETDKAMALASKVLSGDAKSPIDKKRAANWHIQEENMANKRRRDSAASGRGRGGRGRGGSRGGGRGGGGRGG